MTEIDIAKIIQHWNQSSDNDFETMIHLYESGDYTWALFIGHIVLEKLLKASVVKQKLNSVKHNWIGLTQSQLSI